MNLSYLLSTFPKLVFPHAIIISDLVLDSRLVQKNALFFALSGTKVDGRQFITDAIEKGACAVLTDGLTLAVDWQGRVPIISIPDLKNQTGKLAAKFYDYPAQKMQIIGVTGTSGKTSCTQFMAAVLHYLKLPCGVIGTLGNGLYGHIQAGNLTTPDAITLQKTLAGFVNKQVTMTVMEVSSHSLDQGRVNGIEFDVGVFTNLTRDHLDYHETMQAYGEAKKRLFDLANFAVINADDAFGREMLRSFKDRDTVFSYSVDPAFRNEMNAMIYAEDVQLTPAGIKAHIVTPWGNADLDTILVGQFNLSNLLSVIAGLCLLDIPLALVMEGIHQLHPVAGRMQSFGGGKKPLVIVDYAHKPDALEKVLIALRQQCQGTLYCVFGCGGDRDRGKRPIMAKIAEQYADKVIVTDDNPRYEDPALIVKDIMQGFENSAIVVVQHDRAKAILETIRLAGEGDCILIAGKGAETYQQIGGEKFPFSDGEKVGEGLGFTGKSGLTV